MGDWGDYQNFNIDTKYQKDVLVNFRDTNYLTQINVTNLDPSLITVFSAGGECYAASVASGCTL